uniref:Calcineurinlike phosphoesterase putative n=1 Tax=Albugo laibachii Nc14 TaxID=890382 RepID=F0WJU3_9STRA|nr:calcineurinlike phosphoesterase putative [Albugo laibachii Nc14]|eukprot:CCA21545.1 calcineurinlike phosphoesterase putative [Albugo laibachii Nc14]
MLHEPGATNRKSVQQKNLRKGKNIGRTMEHVPFKMMTRTRKKRATVFDHGDSVYYHGIIPENAAARMKASFEHLYHVSHSCEIRWMGVFGNHDLGGGGPLCIKEDEYKNTLDPTKIMCDTSEQAIKTLKQLVAGQTSYNEHNKLWCPKKNYYMETFTKGDVVVDAFFVDMNSTKDRGVDSIYCQCYVPETNEKCWQCHHRRRTMR